jgi:threonyl-tRNA synthetase
VYRDICAGPHLDSTGQLGIFKLTRLAGAYWRGDEKNNMLTRIYGVAFATKEEFEKYEHMLEEAAKRDHRKIGKELDLFSFQGEGPGFPFWHPKGMRLINELVRFWQKEHQAAEYEEIRTPIMLNESLWHQSGHWDNYKENMYFTEIDEQPFAVKPMNCPGGILIYKNSPHSYRELPLRWGELGLVHRHELSGVLHGLFRVRMFTQDDAHIFCTKEQVAKEVEKMITFYQKFYDTFEFTYRVELSTRPEKRVGDDAMWDLAEEILEKVIKNSGIPFEINEGDGAFYGPKLDFHLQDTIGRSWQCGTIQLDFSMPERFDMTYIGEDGAKHRVVMLHRALFGSLERFLGILLEHTAGALPVWLAPVQVMILPVSDSHMKYAAQLLQKIQKINGRAELLDSSETLGKRLRTSQIQKVSFSIIIGDDEVKNGKLTIRRYGEKKDEKITESKFLDLLR